MIHLLKVNTEEQDSACSVDFNFLHVSRFVSVVIIRTISAEQYSIGKALSCLWGKL